MHTSLAPSCVLRCLTCCLHIPQRDVLFCGLVGVVRGARFGLYETFGGDEFLVCLNCRAGRVFGCDFELGLDAHGYRLHRIQSMIHCKRYIQFQVISENSKKKCSNMIVTVLVSARNGRASRGSRRCCHYCPCVMQLKRNSGPLGITNAV